MRGSHPCFCGGRGGARKSGVILPRMSASVSVLIAAWKAERWIGDTLESVFAQELDGHDVEVIVGSDACCSSLDEARRRARGRAGIYMADRNVGPYVMFNSLRHYAAGTHIVYHGADDLMEPTRLARMLEATKRLPGGGGIVGTWYRDIDEHGTPGRRTNTPADGAVMVTQSVIDLVGGFRPWRCAADTEFLLRAMQMGVEATVVAKHLLLRRVHPGQLTEQSGTGFGSPLRVGYERKITVQLEAWKRGEEPERVQPETVPLTEVR